MRKSVVDDLDAISARHRELFPKPAATHKFKEPKNRLTDIDSKMNRIILIYENVQYARDKGGWYEIE